MLPAAVPGGLLVFLGAAFWSLNSPLVKGLSVDPLLICGLRSIFAVLALVGFLRPKRLRWGGWMLVYLVTYAALCISIILALTMTSAPVAIGMQYTATIWLFLAGLVKTRRFRMSSFGPVCVIFVGVLFFMASGRDGASFHGNLIALSEGIFFALMTVSCRRAAGDNVLGLTCLANVFTGLVTFLLFPASLAKISQLTVLEWALIVLLGVVQVAGGYSFYNLGLQRTTPQKASIIALWEMILGPVWVALFLHEYPSVPVMIGFVIILAGMLLDALLPKAEPERGESGTVRLGRGA